MRGRGLLIVVISAAALALVAHAAVAAVTPEPILATAAKEYGPVYQEHDGAVALAWFQDRIGKPRQRVVYVREGDAAPVRISIAGTWGYSPSLAGEQVYYQQVRKYPGPEYASVIYRRNLDATGPELLHQLTSTGGWLWSPSFSDGRLLYGENHFGDQDLWFIRLWNGGQQIVTLATERSACACLRPSQLNGSYASWIRRNHVFVWRLGVAERAPRPPDRYNYVSAVSHDGTAYYVQSNRRCGVNSQLWRWDGNDPPTMIYDFPAGTEPGNLSAFDESDGSTTLYLDDIDCDTGQSDLARMANVDTATIDSLERVVVARGGRVGPTATREPEGAGPVTP